MEINGWRLGENLVWGFGGMFWLSVALFGGLVLLRGNAGLQYIQTTRPGTYRALAWHRGKRAGNGSTGAWHSNGSL